MVPDGGDTWLLPEWKVSLSGGGVDACCRVLKVALKGMSTCILFMLTSCCAEKMGLFVMLLVVNFLVAKPVGIMS